jgi:hypothetical protein
MRKKKLEWNQNYKTHFFVIRNFFKQIYNIELLFRNIIFYGSKYTKNHRKSVKILPAIYIFKL